MKIVVDRIGENFVFEAKNESGNTVIMDASPAIGGEGKGARPMELLIMGLGGCSGIDVINILKKQKSNPKVFRILIHAEREADVTPSLFKKIHIIYEFSSEVDPDKAKRAVELSIDKYCSVTKTLEYTATITHEIKMV